MRQTRAPTDQEITTEPKEQQPTPNRDDKKNSNIPTFFFRYEFWVTAAPQLLPQPQVTVPSDSSAKRGKTPFQNSNHDDKDNAEV